MKTRTISVRRAIALGSGAALCAAAAALAPGAGAVTATADLGAQTAQQVASALVGPGVTVSDVTYIGDPRGAGTFTGGASSVGFDGVILASGSIANAIGPNTESGKTTAFGAAGDGDLTALAGFDTHDASVLEFDFVPNADTVFFEYVFASEEYNEYVNTPFNDTFAFFVNGTNCAVVNTGSGNQPISVNTINNGNPAGDPTATNPALYRDNAGGALNTEYDGATIVLTCMAAVNNGVTNHMKLAIADGSDTILDSGVFLKQGSLSTTPPQGDGKVTGGGKIAVEGGAATLGTTVIQDEQGLRGNLQVNDHASGAKFHGSSVSSLAVDTTTRTATWNGAGRFNGADGYTFEAVVVDRRNGNAAKKGAPDTVSIVVKDGGGAVVWTTDGAKDLNFGNLTVH